MHIRKVMNMILTTVILCISVSIMPISHAVSYESRLDREEFLCSAEIVPSKRGMTEIITRAEFCSYIYKMTGKEGAVFVYQFKDVSPMHPAYECIAGVSSRNYMVGDSEGMFYPDKAITVNEAVKVIVCMLGYSYEAERNGGYPTGYINTAGNIGLMNNSDINGEDELNFKEAVNLLYNALDINIMKQNQNGYFISDDETILKSYLNIFKISGRVNANGYEALEGDTVGENQVVIGNEKYETGASGVSDALGADIKCFVKNDDEGNSTVLYYYTNSDIIEISSADILDASSSWIKYDENGKTKTEDIPQDVLFIYNGKLKFSFGVKDLIPKTGNVTLIKNNGRVTCIKVMNYEVNILDYFNRDNNIMYFKESSKSIDIGKGTAVYHITKNGKTVSDYKFNEYDVICVAESEDGKFVNIVVSNEKTDGKISTVSNDKIYIDGIGYRISENFIGDKGSVKVSYAGTFYFDFLGNIVYMKYVKNSCDYCFFVKAVHEDGEDVTKIKYIDSDGNINIDKLAKKAKYNGIGLSQNALELDEIRNSVVRIKINSDGDITQIIPPQDNTAGSMLDYDSSEFSMDMNCASVRYLTNSDGLVTDGIRVWHIPKSTPVLNIETDENGDVSCDESENVTIGDILTSGKEYSELSFYDVDKLTFIPGFILRVTNSAKKMETDGNTSCVIEKFWDVIDKNDEPAKAVSYYNNGELKTSVIKESAYNATDKFIPTEYYGIKISDVEKGDVCLFTLNKNNEILAFMPSFIRSKSTDDKILTTDTSGYAQIRGYESVYGKIITANEIQVMLNLGGAEYNYLLSESNVYSYNESKNTLTPVSMNYLRGCIGKQCYVRSDRKTAEVVVIYE